MNNRGKNQDHEGVSILEAVETLSDIIDLQILADVGIAKTHQITLGSQAVSYRSIEWLHNEDVDSKLKDLREVFKVVLTYLKDYYKKQYLQIDHHQNIEGIKNIMVLVGEAAKKLDRFTAVFNRSSAERVTEWKEYKQLQDFYVSRIARHIDEGVLSKWILGLAQRAFNTETPLPSTLEKGLQAKHVFVDLEAVKKDTEHELFFIRKEDGSRFFSPKLIRNMKLVCDFGDYLTEPKTDDPLADLPLWQDRFLHACAKDLYHEVHQEIKEFYQKGIKHRNQELVHCINKAIMALMLSSNSRHLMRNSPPKVCLEYFQDFQKYLRDILVHSEYQRLMTYTSSDEEENSIIKTVQALCGSFFKASRASRELITPIQNLIKEAKLNLSQEHLEAAKRNHQLWNRLGYDHSAMNKLIKRRNGHLLKILNMIEENHTAFDPIIQGGVSSQYYSLYFNDTKIDCLHLPCPVRQEIITKAFVNEEFKNFLSRIKKQGMGKHLLVNLQDRTSWREYERCRTLEELQYKEDFVNQLVVITLPKDTEFYHQLAPYLSDRHGQDFFKRLKDQVLDESTGFYFPEAIKEELTEGFLDELIASIHRIFFHSKNVLLQDHRLDFIEIFYSFLVLKILETQDISSFSFTCKDGADVGNTSAALLYAIYTLLNEDQPHESLIDYMNVIIYFPAMLARERMVNPERFKRMLSAIKLFETIRDEHGLTHFKILMREAFGRLYKSNVFDSKLIIPR